MSCLPVLPACTACLFCSLYCCMCRLAASVQPARDCAPTRTAVRLTLCCAVTLPPLPPPCPATMPQMLLPQELSLRHVAGLDHRWLHGLCAGPAGKRHHRACRPEGSQGECTQPSHGTPAPDALSALPCRTGHVVCLFAGTALPSGRWQSMAPPIFQHPQPSIHPSTDHPPPLLLCSALPRHAPPPPCSA